MSRPIDRLEARRLLSGGNPLSWDLLGTEAGDQITIALRASDQRLIATMNGTVVATRLLKNTDVIELSGLGGNDVIVIDLHGDNAPGCWINGGTGRDYIVGGPANDMLLGGSGRDLIDGGRGDDGLRGGTDRDELIGGDGSDYCQGNAGNDTIAGGWGDDTLTGGAGLDQLRGGDDGDILVGGKDADTLKGGLAGDDLQPGGGANTIFRQAGIDSVASGTLDTLAVDDSDEPLHRLQTESELHDWLIEQAVEQWKWALGKIEPGAWQWYRGDVIFASTDGQLVNLAAASDSMSTISTSQTNTQELGVDEADLIETDGEFLYLLDGNDLVIADASPAKDLAIVSRTTIEGSVRGIYLDGGRVTVVSQIGGFGGIIYGFGGGIVAADVFAPEPTEDPKVEVTVFDVADRSDPKVIETTGMDGWLNDSRMIDGRLYVVVNNYLSAPAPTTTLNDDGDLVYESESAYRARLQNLVDDMIPGYSAKVGGSDNEVTGALIEAPDIYVRDGPQLDTTSVVLLNTRDASAGPVSRTSVVGANGQIYASEDSLYLTGYAWQNNSTETSIVKFGLGVDQVTLEATGSVAGSVLDPFSMSENGQFFRIATTTGSLPAERSNQVAVLDQIGDDLTTVGLVDGLGDGETLTAARFRGDKGYLVTFLRVDPLFVLDLSEPTAPALKGELEIPGFSEYLHPIGDNHLIGLGFDADENGLTTRLQLSLFDVSDPAHPTRVDTYGFGDTDYSTAVWDYHAFNYFAEQGVLAIPLASGADNSLELIKVDPTSGFSRLASIDATSAVQRSVRIGQDIYVMSTDAVTVQSLDEPDNQLASIELKNGGGGGVVVW